MTATGPGITPDFQQGATDADGNAILEGGALATGAVPPPPPVQLSPNNNGGGNEPSFTTADVERIRQQERDKLYPQLKQEQEARKTAERELAERQAAETAETARLAEEARLAAEAEMDARQLVESRTADFEQRLNAEREERLRLEAMLEQERRYSELSEVRSSIVDRERENILPELIDLIHGNTTEELEQSAASLKDRTASILGNVSAATTQTRQAMVGTSLTAPPVGPLEQEQTYEQVTAADIAAMDTNTYAQHRDRLRSALSTQVRNSGIYG